MFGLSTETQEDHTRSSSLFISLAVHQAGSAARPANVEAAKLVRALEKIRSEVNRLDVYMKDLNTFHKEDSIAQSTAVVIPKEA
ncbi:unnamed protein product, partial [Ectocarpus sp. 4 AP-2014]